MRLSPFTKDFLTRCILPMLFSAVAVPVYALVPKDRDLGQNEMALSRGASPQVCKYDQTCDAYNHYSANCAGKDDNTTCISCQNPGTTVTYLDQLKTGCTGGWKFGDKQPAGVNCGPKTDDPGLCKNQSCDTTKATWSIIHNCDQPNEIAKQ